jgi:hypothetical protein
MKYGDVFPRILLRPLNVVATRWAAEPDAKSLANTSASNRAMKNTQAAFLALVRYGSAINYFRVLSASALPQAPSPRFGEPSGGLPNGRSGEEAAPMRRRSMHKLRHPIGGSPESTHSRRQEREFAARRSVEGERSGQLPVRLRRQWPETDQARNTMLLF